MPKYYRVNLKDKENNIIYPNIHNLWTFKSNGDVYVDTGDIRAKDGRKKYVSAITYDPFNFETIYDSFIGTIKANDVWYNIINVRHRNNTGDGVKFGMQIRSNLITLNSELQYRNQTNRGWSDWHSIMNLEQEQTVSAIKTFSNNVYFTSKPVLKGETSTALWATLNNCSEAVIQVKNGGQYGHNLLIGAGGNTVIGSGESAESFYNNNLVDDTGETMFITSDGEISFYTNCQDINNKKLTLTIGSNGCLYIYYDIYTVGSGTFGSSSTYKLVMGGGGSFCWIDCRLTSDNTVKSNILLAPAQITLGKNTIVNGTIVAQKEIQLSRNDSNDTKFQATRSDTGVSVWMGVGSGGENHGIYSQLLGKWMVHANKNGVYLSGNASSANQAPLVSNLFSSRPTSSNITITGSGGLSTFKSTGSMTTGKPLKDGHIIHMYWDNLGGWDNQIAVLNGSNPNMQIRGQNSGTWGGWKNIIKSENNSIINLYAITVGTWNSNYSSYENGTIAFCW